MTTLKKLLVLSSFLALTHNALAAATPESPAGQQQPASTEASRPATFSDISGRIEYDITDSEHRKVGLTRIINEFAFTAGRYRCVSTFVSASGKNQFISEGRIEGDHLVPTAFSRHIAGHQDFKIDIGHDTIVITKSSGASESLRLLNAPADIVSTLYQAASIIKETDSMLLAQMNVYGIETATMSYIGEETLDTSLGPQRVIHVRNKTPATTQDIWIAPDQHNLPVKFTIPVPGTALIASVSTLQLK